MAEGSLPAGAAAVAAFLVRFDAYVARTGCRAGELSERLMGRHDRVGRLRRGLNVGVHTLDKTSESLAALEAQEASSRAAEARERPVRVGGRS